MISMKKTRRESRVHVKRRKRETPLLARLFYDITLKKGERREWNVPNHTLCVYGSRSGLVMHSILGIYRDPWMGKKKCWRWDSEKRERRKESSDWDLGWLPRAWERERERQTEREREREKRKRRWCSDSLLHAIQTPFPEFYCAPSFFFLSSSSGGSQVKAELHPSA